MYEFTQISSSCLRYFTPMKSETLSQSSVSRYSNTTAAPEVTDNDPVRVETSNYFDLGVIHKFNENLRNFDVDKVMDGLWKFIKEKKENK